mgnify:FL=1
MSFFTGNVAVSGALSVVATILAIVVTVLAFIFIVPEKRREKLNAFGKFLHDTCNFKYLVVEKIFQALYIFATAAVILNGFFMLFTVVYGQWLGGYGILVMILGPIVIRLVYELLMMVIILIKNVISINNKLKNQNGDNVTGDVFASPDISGVREAIKQQVEAKKAETAEEKPAAPAAKFCIKCGAKLDENGNCPNCK